VTTSENTLIEGSRWLLIRLYRGPRWRAGFAIARKRQEADDTKSWSQMKDDARLAR